MSQQINLYNPILLQQKKYFSARAMAQALAVLALGLLAFYGYARFQVANLETASARSDQRLVNAQERVGRLAQTFSPPTKNPALENQIIQIEVELKTLTQTQQALQQSGALDHQGFSPYFKAMARQIVDGLWLTGFSVGSGEMRISGRALKPELVPDYIRRLGGEPAMRGRQFSTLEMRQPEASKTDEATPPGAARFIEFTLQTAVKAADSPP